MRQLFMTTVTPVIFRLLLTSLFLITTGGCSQESEQKSLFTKTQSVGSNLTDSEKIKNYEYIVKTSEEENIRTKAARQLVNLFFKSNEYSRVDQYLKYLIVNGSSSSERVESLQKLADNLYYNLKKYRMAIREYKKLLEIDKGWITNQLMIVKSYFNLGQFNQVEVEIEKLLGREIPKFIKFEALSARADTYFAKGDFSKASENFKNLMEKFPKLAQQNHVALNYALSLEEQGLMDLAVSILLDLKKTYHSPAFIDSKVEHLNAKMKKLPGSRNFAR